MRGQPAAYDWRRVVAKKSFFLSAINLLCPGMAQVMIGKTVVGIVFNALTILAYLSCIWVGIDWDRSSRLKPAGWLFLFTSGATTLLSVLDAVLSIRFQRANGAVHPFQLFPIARSSPSDS